MSHEENTNEEVVDGEEGIASGFVMEIGSLPDGVIGTESGLAKWFGRHPGSIRRAVERRELPPPAKLLGKPVWTVGSIRSHLEGRLAEAEASQRAFDKRTYKDTI